MVTAQLPAFAQPGQLIDVVVNGFAAPRQALKRLAVAGIVANVILQAPRHVEQPSACIDVRLACIEHILVLVHGCGLPVGELNLEVEHLTGAPDQLIDCRHVFR